MLLPPAAALGLIVLSCRGWCCHWLREVTRQHDEGKVICCAVSNVYAPVARLTLPMGHVNKVRKGGSQDVRRLLMLSMFWFVNSTGRGRELQSLASEYWVKKYGAGSSELSDARAEDFNLAKRLGFVHLGRLAGFLLGSVRWKHSQWHGGVDSYRPAVFTSIG